MRGPLRIAASLASAVILTLALVAAVATAQVDKVGFAKVALADPFASFPVDARGEAMGLATTVDPRGPTAFWWNPAPLPGRSGVAFSYTSYEYPDGWLTFRPLALRATRGNLTAGFLWAHIDSEPVPAPVPPGSEGTLEPTKDLYQLGLAADLMPWLAGGSSRWAWTVGANVRHLEERMAEIESSAWDADLGTTLARTFMAGPELAVRLLATGMVRNLFRSDRDFEPEISIPLPRYCHFGLGLEVGSGPRWRGHRAMVGTVLYALYREMDDQGGLYDSEHLGLELTAGGIFSLRAGHRTQGPGFEPNDGWSWGAGARYQLGDGQGPWAAVDYAALDVTNLIHDGQLDRWTLTVGFDLPR